MRRLFEILRRWWPVPTLIAGSAIAQILTRSDATPFGHDSNATMLFAIAPAVAITIWASTSELRRGPTLWLLNAAIVPAIAVVYTANIRIVDATGAERWTEDQAGTLGPTRVAPYDDETVISIPLEEEGDSG